MSKKWKCVLHPNEKNNSVSTHDYFCCLAYQRRFIASLRDEIAYEIEIKKALLDSGDSTCPTSRNSSRVRVPSELPK